MGDEESASPFLLWQLRKGWERGPSISAPPSLPLPSAPTQGTQDRFRLRNFTLSMLPEYRGCLSPRVFVILGKIYFTLNFYLFIFGSLNPGC